MVTKLLTFIFMNIGSEKVLDFELEEEEEAMVLAYCKENAKE